MTSSSEAPEIIFRGIDGTECEEFIAAIEKLAFAEGWSRDRERMLLFARSGLRHKALRWFAKLDPSKKGDWDSFVDALFDQYSLVEEVGAQEVVTPIWSETRHSASSSTAIRSLDLILDSQTKVDHDRKTIRRLVHSVPLAIGRPYDPTASKTHVGTLRVSMDDSTAFSLYISKGQRYYNPGYFDLQTTVNRQEALVICFTPESQPHHVGCMNKPSSDSKSLSLWYSGDAKSHRLRVMDGVCAIPQNEEMSGNVTQIWNLATDGTLEASLCALALDSSVCDSQGKLMRHDFKTTEIHLDSSGSWVAYVKPGTPLCQDDPTRGTALCHPEIKAKIIFEPL